MKPILVTGSHRSGSTWVGKMIAASPAVGYIQEPFSLNHDLGICGAQFQHWFTYVSAENEAQYLKDLQNTINFKYNFVWDWQHWRDRQIWQCRLQDYAEFRRYRHRQARPLLKDPIALFSAEWLASRFDMDVVVVIRHPAAFAYSLKKAGWGHPFSHFLAQPLLMRDYLHPFEPEIRAYAAAEKDIVDQASLLWKLIHYMIALYQDKYKNWIFVRHEDLSLDPVSGFQTVYEQLNLTFSDAVKRVIEDYSSSRNQADLSLPLGFYKRDSKANIRAWKTGLSAAEIESIREQVGEVGDRFYQPEEW